MDRLSIQAIHPLISGDLLVWLKTERDDGLSRVRQYKPDKYPAIITYNKAECEPMPPFVDFGREIAAILTLRCDVLVSLQQGAKHVSSACEDEGHFVLCGLF